MLRPGHMLTRRAATPSRVAAGGSMTVAAVCACAAPCGQNCMNGQPTPACSAMTGRRLPPDLSGQFPGLVLVRRRRGGTSSAARPPGLRFPACAPERPPGGASRAQPGPATGRSPWPRTRRSRCVQRLVAGLALGSGLRIRIAGFSACFLNGVPAVQGELRRNAVPGQHVAGDPLSVPGGGLGACVQEDLPVIRADGDAAADLAADVFFHLTQGKRPLRLSSCASWSLTEMVTRQSSLSATA